MAPVQLYIYDLTRGLAAKLSPLFLGKQINGIWHTGIVVYGKEYFFGGMGIESCDPGSTMIGQPHKIEDLGETKITQEGFQEFLSNLRPKFDPGKFHLLEHNSNNFTSEAADFLTGTSIPSYISNLPSEVIEAFLEMPFGAQIRPLLQILSDPGTGGKPEQADKREEEEEEEGREEGGEKGSRHMKDNNKIDT